MIQRGVSPELWKGDSMMEKKQIIIKVKKNLDEIARKITDTDIKKVLAEYNNVKKMANKLPGLIKGVKEDTLILLGMVKDYWSGKYRNVSWYTIAISVAALLYLISPIDVIPDWIFAVGLVDDAMLIKLALDAIEKDYKKYKKWKKAQQ